tara:strand:+ start:309 stop:488 length:180 start_codon:yes stop_codon:yes gene_type:complete
MHKKYIITIKTSLNVQLISLSKRPTFKKSTNNKKKTKKQQDPGFNLIIYAHGKWDKRLK